MDTTRVKKQEELQQLAGLARERREVYQEECKKKRELPKVDNIEVGKLDDSMTDVTSYMGSPSKVEKQKIALEPGKLQDSMRLEFENSLKSDEDNEEECLLHLSGTSGSSNGANFSLRPGVMRGQSFDDGPQERGGGADYSMRPGMFRGASFGDDPDPVKPQAMKDKEEKETKEKVVTLLDKESEIHGEEVEPTQATTLKPFSSVRSRYLHAVKKLRPEQINTGTVTTKKDKETAKKFRKKRLKEEANKKERYENLAGAWDQYDEAAQDKPEEPTEEEKEIEEEVEKVEEEVAEEWIDFAEKVVKEKQEDSDSDDEEDEDLAFWIAEAKRLKEEAEARKRSKEEAEARKKAKEEKRRKKKKQALSEEDEKWREEARKLREAAIAKEGEVAVRKMEEDAKKREELRKLREAAIAKERELANCKKEDEARKQEELKKLREAAVAKEQEVEARKREKEEDDERKSEELRKLREAAVAKEKELSSCKKADEAKKKEELRKLREAAVAKERELQLRKEQEEEARKKAAEESKKKNGYGSGSESDEASVMSDRDDEASQKERKKSKSYFSDSDSDVSDLSNDPALLSPKKKNGRKVGSSRDKSEDSDVSDSGKHHKKKANGRKVVSYSDNDSDSDDSDNAKRSKKKKKGRKLRSGDADSDSDASADVKRSKKKKNKKNCKSSSGSLKSDSDSDESDNGKSPKKKKKHRNCYSSDSEESALSDDEKVSKKKKRHRNKSQPADADDEDDAVALAPKTPKTKKKKNVELIEDEALEVPTTPRNPDGTLWKNPLRGWANRPKKVKEIGSQIIVRVPEKTDCWRKTRHNFIMDNAPFYWHKVTGNFEVVVKISGGFNKMYDKAGIMVREDEKNWIMSGMECFNDRMNHSTCITCDHTDWSLAPLPENSEKAGIWFCVKRLGNAYEAFYSTDGKKWIQTRQGLFSERPVLKVGVMCACPMGDSFKVVFECFCCRSM